MQDLLNNLTAHEAFTPMFFVFGVGGVIAIIAMLFGSVVSLNQTKEREKSRREIAAYIAEGSMTSEEGERLLNAGQGKKNRG